MKEYDPKKVIVTVGGVTIKGFADGTMVTSEYTEPQRSMQIGATGEGRHIRKADRSGTTTMRLFDSSVSNAVLSAFDIADVPVPLLIADKTSNADVVVASSAMVQKVPASEKGAEMATLEWVLQWTSGLITHSGAKD
jgi:hypothetical protein